MSNPTVHLFKRYEAEIEPLNAQVVELRAELVTARDDALEEAADWFESSPEVYGLRVSKQLREMKSKS